MQGPPETCYRGSKHDAATLQTRCGTLQTLRVRSNKLCVPPDVGLSRHAASTARQGVGSQAHACYRVWEKHRSSLSKCRKCALDGRIFRSAHSFFSACFPRALLGSASSRRLFPKDRSAAFVLQKVRRRGFQVRSSTRTSRALLATPTRSKRSLHCAITHNSAWISQD